MIANSKIEQLFYFDGEPSASVWFILPESAENLITYVERYDVVVDGNHIEYELMQTNLAKSPAKSSITHAPDSGMSSTIQIQTSRDLSTVETDLQNYGPWISKV